MLVPETTTGTWVVSSAVDDRDTDGLELLMKGEVKPEMTDVNPMKVKRARRILAKV